MLSFGKALVAAEEALFLLEFHGFKLFDASVFPETLKELIGIYDIMRPVVGECGLTSYKVCKIFLFFIIRLFIINNSYLRRSKDMVTF